MKPASYKIPSGLNALILTLCSVLYCWLLYTASHTTLTSVVFLCAVAFAFVMVPVYSFIHEAEHGLLHPNEKTNHLLGIWLSTLFIVSFTFLKHCHLKHHKKNRTDEEMWDLYYEHQHKWKRFGNLYGMMIGAGYFALWLSVLLFAVAPQLLYTRFFRAHSEVWSFIKDSKRNEKFPHYVGESWLAITFQVACFLVLDLRVVPWLILFASHGFLWASQNYVNHAFSPRDIIDGAHNLTLPGKWKWIYLNFNLHLAHHQNPKIPWIHLPAFIRREEGRMSFLKNYVRLWKGPRLTLEPDPAGNPRQETITPQTESHHPKR